jgi:hypothetical protein
LFPSRKKVGIKQEQIKPQNLLLGLLNKDTELHIIPGRLDIKPNSIESQKEISRAMAEAEYLKAKATLSTYYGRTCC